MINKFWYLLLLDKCIFIMLRALIKKYSGICNNFSLKIFILATFLDLQNQVPVCNRFFCPYKRKKSRCRKNVKSYIEPEDHAESE